MDKEPINRRDNARSALKKREIHFDRVELLANALYAFAQPVPDYEPVLPPRIARLLQRHDI
jgi:hypothetical protein